MEKKLNYNSKRLSVPIAIFFIGFVFMLSYLFYVCNNATGKYGSSACTNCPVSLPYRQ